MFGLLKKKHCLFDVTGPRFLIRWIFNDYIYYRLPFKASDRFDDYIVKSDTGTCKAYGEDGLLSDK